MKKLLLLLCCFHLTAKAGIQKASEFDALTIKLALHELVDPMNSTIQLGLEYKPLWRFGVQAEYGYHAYRTRYSDWHYNESFSKFRLRAKFYYYEKKKLNMYAGIDYFYCPKNFDLKNSYIYNPDHQHIDAAHVNKKTNGIFLVDGLTVKKWNRIRFDIDVNFGLRISHVHFSNIVHPTPEIDDLNESYFDNGDTTEGLHYLPHVGFGVRFGYVLSSGKISR